MEGNLFHGKLKKWREFYERREIITINTKIVDSIMFIQP